MRRITPQQQLREELDKLSVQEREDLCIALVAYLRLGIRQPIINLLFG